MKLYELLVCQEEGTEFTVYDDSYDTEFYFYSPEKDMDKWDIAMMDIAKCLDVINVDGNTCCCVDMSELIENKLNELENLFCNLDVDLIMEDMNSILSGGVSEEWLIKFAEALNE